ncbi:neprosin family prolyl endopeptidase [Nocardia sp. NPDC101769]|uniref:neprosin family prolyl endopeptidase n=1 Tax=Nocardia sp. NPDC101769 TaxID=3364333 RepID=UPI003806A6C8
MSNETGSNKDAEAIAARHVAPHPAAVATTTTAGGRLIDWVPIESQVPGGQVATPPPAPADSGPRRTTAPFPGELGAVAFELQDPNAERGPEGTVPILRDLAVHARRVARRGADKKGIDRRGAGQNAGAADPNPFGYYHATSGQSGTFYGCQSFLAVYDPSVENGSDHSINQFGLQNYDNPQPQSLEAGWTVDQGLNGDASPHIFTYYTTNGYTNDGDNLGGYNETVQGWIQYDATAHPGAAINGISVIGGRQIGVSMKFQLWQGNWWFQVQGVWLGYYPASLFGTAALADHAGWAGFWGEVYSALADPTQTTTQMGSGEFAEAGWPNACFQNGIQVQTVTDGTMSDLNGSASQEDSTYYDIAQTMQSGAGWGSYFFAGGPGNGVAPAFTTLVTEKAEAHV